MASYTSAFAGSENPLSEGGAWTTGGGDWDNVQKVSGVARGATSNPCGAFVATPTIGNDQYAQLTLVATTTNRDGGPVVRVQSSTNAGCYVADADRWDGVLKCLEHTDGSGYAQLGSTYTHTFVANDILRIEISGTGITCKLNGTTRITTSDATFTAGQPGMFMEVNTTNDWDDFDGGDLGGAQDTPELYGRPRGLHGSRQMQQALAF